MSSRQRAILACLILAVCALPFVFWQPDWVKLVRAAEARATKVVSEIQLALSTDTPAPTRTVGPSPTRPHTPTATKTSTATPTPVPPSATPRPLGRGRGQPYAQGELVHAPGWDVRIDETLRGEAAWQAIGAANRYNQPSREGFEYLLVKLSVQCTYTDEAAHKISGGDFDLTGDRMVRYNNASVVEPDPILDAELYSGGEFSGWVAFQVASSERNLVLIVDELASHDADAERYLAVDEAASLAVDPALADLAPTHEDASRANPIPLGDVATTDNWQVTVQGVVRGDAAWTMIQAANQFNAPPDQAMEYVAVRVRVTNIATDDRDVRIDEFAFRVTGSARILHKTPNVVNPAPSLEGRLYPGGSLEGWIVQQCAEGETHLVLVFQPRGSASNDVRFLSIE